MVSLSVLFLSLMVGCRVSAPRAAIEGSLAASPPSRVIERRCTEVHSQTWVFFYFRTKSHSLLMQGKSPLDGAAGYLVEGDTEDDDLRAKLSGLCGAARGAGETLAQERH